MTVLDAHITSTGLLVLELRDDHGLLFWWLPLDGTRLGQVPRP